MPYLAPLERSQFQQKNKKPPKRSGRKAKKFTKKVIRPFKKTAKIAVKATKGAGRYVARNLPELVGAAVYETLLTGLMPGGVESMGAAYAENRLGDMMGDNLQRIVAQQTARNMVQGGASALY